MNRIVNASPTNPSTTSLNGRIPSSCGWRNPRLYSCVAIVDVLTSRTVSSTPSGSGSSPGASSSGSVMRSAPLLCAEGLAGAQWKAGRAVAPVDQLRDGHGVVRTGRHGRSTVERLDERLELVGVGRAGAEVFGRLTRLGADHEAVVERRLDEVRDGRLASGPLDAQAHVACRMDHARPHRARGAGGEAQ